MLTIKDNDSYNDVDNDVGEDEKDYTDNDVVIQNVDDEDFYHTCWWVLPWPW